MAWLAELWHCFWIDWHQSTLRAAWVNHRAICPHALDRYTHHVLRLAKLEAL